jgi:hypothetical protein
MVASVQDRVETTAFEFGRCRDSDTELCRCYLRRRASTASEPNTLAAFKDVLKSWFYQFATDTSRLDLRRSFYPSCMADELHPDKLRDE